MPLIRTVNEYTSSTCVLRLYTPIPPIGDDPAVDQALEVHWMEVSKIQRGLNANLWSLLQQFLPLPLPALGTSGVTGKD